MFEKEAKKWVKENTRIEHSASFGEIAVEPSAEKGFKEGAEFGYNKAKAESEDQIKQIEKVSDYNADQLAKAKDIIQQFLIQNPISDWLIEKAERFSKGE